MDIIFWAIFFKLNFKKVHLNFVMKNRLRKRFILFSLMIFVCTRLDAQTLGIDSLDKTYVTVIAGKQYNRSSLHQLFWGKHYRKEWAAKVSVPRFLLDTAAGGLKPYEAGGGRQSKTLRLRTANDKEYVLRSIDKTFGGALSPIYHNTFVENVANDQVSVAHPYAAVTIPDMAEAAKIYHTWPQIVYVPKQNALDSFNATFGNDLYLFEQRPDENWEEADNFGNSNKIISTENLLEKKFEDNDHQVDQLAFVRARLFDMLIGDWGRHEDQWGWASYKSDGKTLYKPIPRDRDQTYTKFDGFLVRFFRAVANLSHVQTFKKTIKNVEAYNLPARNLDRQMANEPALTQWIAIAEDIKILLTDNVIESSVKKLPKEVFPISGPEIIAKLKSRRDDLVTYAKDYYLFLAKEVEVVGSKEEEYFEIKRLNNETLINVHKIDKEGKTEKEPYYSRTFKNGETKEVRLYGLAGKDVYNIGGDVENGLKIRIIGGTDKDSITDASTVKSAKATLVYDNNDNNITSSSATRLHLSNDTAIHRYQYNAYKYDRKGIRPTVFYSEEDKLYVGIGYKITKQQWRKEPFGYQHGIAAHYSISQKAPSFTYKGTINRFINKWNLGLLAKYDLVRWTNFYGVGNEVKPFTDDRDFYRMRTREALAGISLYRKLGKYISLDVSPFFHTIDIIRDEERFVAKNFNSIKDLYEQKNYFGTGFGLTFSHLNNDVLPTSGVVFSAGTSYNHNLKESDENFTKYIGKLNFYLPIFKKLVLAINSGAATLSGKPEFYELNSMGGSRELRGYRKNRFWGKSFFYSSNELQYIFNVRSQIFNGKAGFIGFYDLGRIWQPGENSNRWHDGYGGGILISPFNKIMVSVTYGISTENKLVHLKFNLPL